MSPDLDLEGKAKFSMEIFGSKDKAAASESLLVNKDNGSVLDTYLAIKDNGTDFTMPLTGKDNGSVLGMPLGAKDNETLLKDPLAGMVDESLLEKQEDKFIRCASNHEDVTFHMEALSGEPFVSLVKSEDMEINITERVSSGEVGPCEADNHEMTESSSSFGDTISGLEDDLSLSDAEVNSQFFNGNASASFLGGCGEAFQMRKKKLTDHWRRFIRPLMWRCRWLELQIKEFQSRALKYDRKLAEFDQMKQFELEKLRLEEFGVKTLPFLSQIQRKQVMKRKKRKRVEDSIDRASYMSHHNLFSYYGNKRSLGEIASVDDGFDNPDKSANCNDEFRINDEWLIQSRDGDDLLEQILRKVYVMQSQVQKLRTRVDKVMTENPWKFSSINKLSLLVPCDALACSAENHASPPYDGGEMLVRSSSECNTGDLIMPESALSSHGEVMPFPDLFASMDQPQVGGLYENIDGILINNEAADEELLNFERARNQPIVTGKPQIPMERQASIDSSDLIPQAETPIKSSVEHMQSALKSITAHKTTPPKNKRKRGKRKAGSNKWHRRS